MKAFRALRAFKRDQQGLALIEFALSLPFLLLLFLGGIEFTRFIQLNQQLDSANSQIANILTQAPALSEADINAVLDTVPSLLQPFDPSTTTHIVSLVARPNADPAIVSDRLVRGGGAGSQIGGLGGPLEIPDFTLQIGDEALVVETYYFYEPLLGGTLEVIGFDLGQEEEGLYRRAVYRSRLGNIGEFN